MKLFPSDIEIAQKSKISSIKDVAQKLHINEDDLELYGKYKAKLPLHLQQQEPKGKLILVSAMSPTKYGEGKTTMTIGLTDGLNSIGKKAIAVLREPSLGPVFGLKGGAAGWIALIHHQNHSECEFVFPTGCRQSWGRTQQIAWCLCRRG